MKRKYKQTAVYWATSTNSGYGETYDAPVEIDCRWEDKEKLLIGLDGEEKMSTAKVFTNSTLAIDGFLFLGDLDDLSSSTAGPRDVAASRKIIGTGKIPDLLGSDFIKFYYLE